MAAGLNKRDTTAHLLDGALLQPITPTGPIRLRRHPPSVALTPFVRHYWFVSWDFPNAQSYVQPVLPLPAVNAVVEEGGAWVYGVWSRRYDKHLTGRGNAWGVLFLPAGFAPLSAGPVYALRDRRAPFERSFGCPGDEVAELAEQTRALVTALHAVTNDVEAVSLLERYLLARVGSGVVHAEVRAWVSSIEADTALIRVEQLAALHGVSVRTLQRAMRQHVGLGPKQLIRRYRLLEAAARLASGVPCNCAELASALGYADQAHFSRDFRAVVGTSPARAGRRALESQLA